MSLFKEAVGWAERKNNKGLESTQDHQTFVSETISAKLDKVRNAQMSIRSFLSIKLRLPPARKSVNFEDFLLMRTFFPHFEPFSEGGETKFCGQRFYGHPGL